MGTHIGQIVDMTGGYRDLTQGVLGNKINLMILMVSLIIVFFLKNSFEKNQKLKLNICYEIQVIFYIVISIFSLSQISEFLYFNF